MLLILVFLLVWNAAGASPFESCGSTLLAQLQKLGARSTSEPLGDAGHLALPSAVRHVFPLTFDSSGELQNWMQEQFGDQKLDRLRGNTILSTKLGPSLWEGGELAAWRKLDQLSEHEHSAHQEIMRMATTDDYCTPGLDIFLCESLRTSRRFFVRATEKHKLSPDVIAEAERQHYESHTPIYPWLQMDRRKFQIGLTPKQSTEIFRTFIREALIAHLLYVDFDNRVRLGLRLPRPTRLKLAKIPELIEFAPLFERLVPDTDEVPRLGSRPGTTTVLAGPIDLGSDEKAQLVIRARSSTKVLSPKLHVPWMRLNGPKERLRFRDQTEARFNQELRRFWRRSDLSKTPMLVANWVDAETLRLEVRGARMRDELLYYYYLLYGKG